MEEQLSFSQSSTTMYPTVNNKREYTNQIDVRRITEIALR